MKPVIVTGGAGYIGAHACKALRKSGYFPITFDNLSHGHIEAVRWGPLVVGDLLDANALHAAFKQYSPCAVLHFAGLISVGESVQKPALYRKNNVEGSLNLLEVMRAHNVGQLVFSSTAAVYGHPKINPIPDDAERAPINPYGFTKLEIEKEIENRSNAGELRAVLLRYFNAAGADPESEIGEAHAPETHLIPLALDAALERREWLSLFGNDYATPDGTCVRDYVHVSDLADAHVSALRYLENAGTTTALNLGTNRGASVLDIVRGVERITGKPVSTRFEPRREGDPAFLVADASRAQEVLNWVPRRSSLDEILASAWKWHERRFPLGHRTALVLMFRHGETDWNAQGRFQGHLDIDLNETGRRQAALISRTLRRYGVQSILSSDLSRARHTAQLAAPDPGVPISIDARLREAQIGEAQGLTYDEMIERFGAQTLQRWRSNDPIDDGVRFPNGETGGDVLQRSHEAIWEYLNRTGHRRIGISTHGGVIRRFVSRAQGFPVTHPPIPNGIIYGVEVDLDSKRMRVLDFLDY